jgi:hypothetical protein
MNLCVFTSVCEEDNQWVNTYLTEISRLDIPFCIHFDRCSEKFKSSIRRHGLYQGSTSQDNPSIEFNETHKQDVLDLVSRSGFDWAIAMDIDEVFENDAERHIHHIASSKYDCVDVRWLNLWEDANHVRVDQEFAKGHRVKFLNLQNGRRWKFDHPITNGPKVVSMDKVILCTIGSSPLVTLHAGMMTKELRRLHKERWDRIYSTALKGDLNPYTFWSNAIETEDQAVLIKHGYWS